MSFGLIFMKPQLRMPFGSYQEGREQRISGTPLELLPGLARERVDSLKAVYIHTIEQLANKIREVLGPVKPS